MTCAQIIAIDGSPDAASLGMCGWSGNCARDSPLVTANRGLLPSHSSGSTLSPSGWNGLTLRAPSELGDAGAGVAHSDGVMSPPGRANLRER